MCNEDSSNLTILNTEKKNGTDYIHGFTTNIEGGLNVTPGTSSIALSNIKYIPAETESPDDLVLNENAVVIPEESIIYINCNIIAPSYIGHKKLPSLQSILLRKSSSVNINFSIPQTHNIQREYISAIAITLSGFNGERVLLHPSSQLHLTFIVKV